MAQTVLAHPARPHALSRSPFALALARGLSLAWRRRVDGVVALLFFFLVAWLLPLVWAPTARELPTLAPAVVWVAALLAMLAGSLRMFQDDAANGALEQMLLAPRGGTLAVAGVLTAHWLTTALPLLAALPLIGVLYGLSMPQWQWLGTSLLLGTPGLCGIVALAAALSLGARSGLMLLTLLTVPLALPVMLFGVRAAQGDAAGGWAQGAVMLLGATALTTIALGPWGVTRALEVALE